MVLLLLFLPHLNKVLRPPLLGWYGSPSSSLCRFALLVLVQFALSVGFDLGGVVSKQLCDVNH